MERRRFRGGKKKEEKTAAGRKWDSEIGAVNLVKINGERDADEC